MSNEPIDRLDEFAKNSPITFEVACKIWGDVPELTDQTTRAAFFAVWALANYEYADAMCGKRTERVSKMW